MRAFLFTLVVVLASIGMGVGIESTAARSGVPKSNHANRPSVITTTTIPTTDTLTPRFPASICPLTDTPAPNGVAPLRPALLVKIGNEPDGARPQSGLNEADIIFDTPAEGFVMRYVAVYQCNDASSIGPTRSVRWVDWNMIARQFIRPILAFAGGIDPNVNGLSSEPWISPANLLEGAASAGIRISSRAAPDNLYTSTGALYGLFKSERARPRPIFNYSVAPPAASSPAASVGINFSYGTDVIWEWDATSQQWLHTYSGVPDIDTLMNRQVTTTNVVIEIVRYTTGPYSEHGCCSGDIQSYTIGSGPGYVMRDGTITRVTWHRKDELAPTTFTDSAGNSVDLAPGRTWVELDPAVQADGPGGISITR